MNNSKKLTHTTWECKYHLVWIPKYQKKIIYGQLRKYLGEILKQLALQKESEIIKGHLMGEGRIKDKFLSDKEERPFQGKRPLLDLIVKYTAISSTTNVMPQGVKGRTQMGAIKNNSDTSPVEIWEPLYLVFYAFPERNFPFKYMSQWLHGLSFPCINFYTPPPALFNYPTVSEENFHK